MVYANCKHSSDLLKYLAQGRRYEALFKGHVDEKEITLYFSFVPFIPEF